MSFDIAAWSRACDDARRMHLHRDEQPEPWRRKLRRWLWGWL